MTADDTPYLWGSLSVFTLYLYPLLILAFLVSGSRCMVHTALLAPLFSWLSAPGVRRLFVDLSSIVRPEGLLNGERSISKRSSDEAVTELNQRATAGCELLTLQRYTFFWVYARGWGIFFLISRSFFQFTIRNNLFIQPLVLPMGSLKGANGKLTYFWEQITDNSFVLNSFTHS